MNYLKQLLLTILVFCTLGYSSAWAFDGHVMEQMDAESGLSIMVMDLSNADLLNIGVSDTDQSHHQNESDIVCDHCCHIFSHLVAIFPDTRSLSTDSTSHFLSNLAESFYSFTVSPDLKPPRV